MQQLEMSWWPPGCVRAVLADYFDMRSDGITEETRDEDYRYRVSWLNEMLGEATPAEAVTYAFLEKVARRARGIIKDATIKKRLAFWLSAARYAALRGMIDGAKVPERPPVWLKNDLTHFDDFYTFDQYREFRHALPPGRFRRMADLSMLTGMHTYDLVRTERQHLDPWYVWPGGGQGRWWRRCNKNASEARKTKIKPCWVPMEPELRELAIEWLGQHGETSARIVGPMNNLHRTFEAAALRAGLPVIRANLGFRASHANLLISRHWPYAYVRIILGHIGEITGEVIDGHVRIRSSKRAETLERHYLRDSPDIMRPPSPEVK